MNLPATPIGTPGQYSRQCTANDQRTHLRLYHGQTREINYSTISSPTQPTVDPVTGDAQIRVPASGIGSFQMPGFTGQNGRAAYDHGSNDGRRCTVSGSVMVTVHFPGRPMPGRMAPLVSAAGINRLLTCLASSPANRPAVTDADQRTGGSFNAAAGTFTRPRPHQQRISLHHTRQHGLQPPRIPVRPPSMPLIPVGPA